MKKHTILNIILFFALYKLNAMNNTQIYNPNSLKEKAAISMAGQIVKNYDKFEDIQKHIYEKNIATDLIEPIYCAINVNLGKSDIFIKELRSRVYKTNKNYLNFDLFYNLCPQAQNIIEETLLGFSKEAESLNSIDSALNRQLLRDIIKESKNKSFDETLYAKLQSIKNSLPKNDPKEFNINSFIKNLDDKYNDPKIFDQNANNKLTDLKNKIIELINGILNKYRSKTDIDKEIQNQTENIKNIVNPYYKKFGLIILFKAFQETEKEINSSNFNVQAKNYILNAIKKLYIPKK